MRNLGLMIVSLAFLAVSGFAEEGQGQPPANKEQPEASASNDGKKADPGAATAATDAKKKEEKKKKK